MSNEDTTQKLPQGFERILAWLDSFEQRLTVLEEKVDQRLLETRSIWEAVLAQLTEAQTDIRNIKYKLRALNLNILDVIANQKHLEDRVDKLEHQPS